MLRRSHKKSWGGCLECKRRHIKCDESRPECILCSKTGRACRYASQIPPKTPSTSIITSSEERSDDPGSHDGDGSSSQSINNYHEPTLDDPINLKHMELFIHLWTSGGIFLSQSTDHYPAARDLAMNTSIEAPYLLYQLLAISARHLAFVDQERSAVHLHSAVTLQTRAISLFNAAWTSVEVDRSNCVAILLFSSALGHHLLADTLMQRGPGGLDTFLDYYIKCVEMHRGVGTIALAAWPILLESDLEPILSESSELTGRAPRGDHCRQLWEMVNDAEGLAEEDRVACRSAARNLQVAFDAIWGEEEKENTRYQMIGSWMLLAPPRFTELLATRRPEVLVLLGWYALLLHFARHLWQVGDSGAYILSMVTDYLGPEWDSWLEWPRETIAKNSA